MTELAALNIRITGDSKDLSAAVSSAQGDLNKLATVSQATGRSMATLQTGTQRTGTGMASMNGKVQAASFQLQDMVVQLQAGTRWTTVMGQQLPQLAGAFGGVGAAIGLLLSVGFAGLGAALASTGGQTLTFAEQIDALKESVSALSEVTDAYSAEGLVNLKEKYGEVTIEVLRLLEAQRAQALFQTQQEAAAAITALVEQYGLLSINLEAVGHAAKPVSLALQAVADSLGMSVPQARELVAKFQELDSASLADKPRILSEIRMQLQAAGITTGEWMAAINMAEDALRQANAEGAKAGGWLATATAGAQAWAASLWDAATAATAARDAEAAPAAGVGGGRGMGPGGPLVGSADLTALQAGGGVYRTIAPGVSGGGGGGGGGTATALQSEIAAMQEALMTQEQIQMESFARQQEMLDQALAQRLISQEEYQGLMQQAQQTHEFAMLQSVNQGVSDTLGALGSLFQGSKKISAAIAVANSWLAFTEVLKDPSYVGRPWARMAAAAKALAAGFNAVRNIKSASPGSGGGSPAGGGSMAAPGGGPAPLQVSLNTYGFGDFMKTGDLRSLLTQLNKVAGDTGYTILVPA